MRTEDGNTYEERKHVKSRHILRIGVFLSKEFYFCDKNTMNEEQVGEKMVYETYTSAFLLITEGCQD